MKYLLKFLNNLIYLFPRILIWTIFILFLIISFLVYFSYFEPYLYPLHFLKGKAEIINENVIIGPYPEKSELKRLKEKFKITTVISLLNPNLPQEKSLLEKEEKIANELGLKLYNFPLEYLDLNSEHNRKVLSELKNFIKEHPKEKFYIHCYLGRHRVKLIKEFLK